MKLRVVDNTKVANSQSSICSPWASTMRWTCAGISTSFHCPVRPSRKNPLGAGPRFGVQGDIPVGYQWSIDWLTGAAVLFGERQVSTTTRSHTLG